MTDEPTDCPVEDGGPTCTYPPPPEQCCMIRPAREPAPWPTATEFDQIRRFGMFEREERLARLAANTNRAVTLREGVDR